MTQAPAPPDPTVVFAMFNAYQQTDALRTAVELELFTAIGSGAVTADALAAHVHAPARGVRMLCDFLVVQGLLSKQDGQYALSPTAAVFLDKKSPAYLGSIAQFTASDTIRDAFRGLTGAVRRGGTILGDQGTMAANHPVWVDFARAMAPMMAPPAQAIAGVLAADGGPVREVLDIAAGHGIFGVTVAQRFPQARVTAVDWAAVLEVAKENAERAGVGDRLRTLPGSAFDVEFGGGYDVVLVTNFYHHFDLETCRTLAQRFHASLAEGGRMITLEMIPNPDRVTPPWPASFALTMLASTARGDAFTFAEYERIFTESGFARNVLHDLAPLPQRVVVSYK
jgi:SAM-dependent methyltransferase